MRGGKLSIIGNGVVLDPWHLVMEIAKLRVAGRRSIHPENLMIAENASLILPIHGELDRARENQNSVAKIGTTGRGIGPAYEDKVGRRAIRVADLADEATLDARVDRLLTHHDALRRGLGIDAESNARALKAASCRRLRRRCCPMPQPVWKVMNEARRAGKRILFEGAQGALLGHRFRDLSLCHLVQCHCRAGGDRVWLGPGAIGFRAGDRQGLYDAGGRRPVPGGAERRRWRTLAQRATNLAP